MYAESGIVPHWTCGNQAVCKVCENSTFCIKVQITQNLFKIWRCIHASFAVRNLYPVAKQLLLINPDVADEIIVFSIRILKVQGSSLGYSDWEFRAFPRFLEANATIAP
jgi:hypothetical protein